MNNTAVVFVHGFTGDENTWVNDDGVSLLTLLDSLPKLSDLSLFEFTYHTKIVNISNSPTNKVVTSLINSVLPKRFKRKNAVIKKNTPISEIAQQLITYVKYELSDYANIIFIGHSMGGLIAKNAIIDISESEADFEHDIIGYCSLSTPHKGSIPSILMAPFNINAKEMKPLDKDNILLNDKWISFAPTLDKTLYIRAKSDEVVAESSSVPFFDIKNFPIEVVEADHTSICKPSSKTYITCKVLEKFLSDCIKKAKIKSVSLESFVEESSSYDKEKFVIKLVLANVDNILIDDAKESFFFADMIKKQASKEDRKKIEALTVLIISTYRTLAGSNNHKTGNDLVSQVHEKIMDLDKQALSCALKHINFIHKKGFLHQEANKNDLKVNWLKSVKLDDISKHKESIGD
jgi:pimeloyl-ACP methyl ester carboxylesterase